RARGRIDTGGERGQHPGRVAGSGGVEGAGPHAVVGGDADDVHGVDADVPQEGVERFPFAGAAFEGGVGRFVLALADDPVDDRGVEVGVEVGAVGPDYAMTWPGRDVVGLVGEMVA